ncbi:MAG: hypothetical protein IJQ79_11570, partial [Bacteroidales bacterium]|nr:hypothetical protein [Bacteroidales bacterium]
APPAPSRGRQYSPGQHLPLAATEEDLGPKYYRRPEADRGDSRIAAEGEPSPSPLGVQGDWR